MKYFALLVLLLVATFLITSSEGRSLSSENINGATIHHRTNKVTKTSAHSDHGQESGSMVISEGDFRPTTPGHSPGVGHSTGPAATYDPQP